jgi:hypothetical protein
MINNYLFFILILVLIIIYFYQKKEQFKLDRPLQDPSLQNCLNKCYRRDVQMANDYSNIKECQEACYKK